MNIPANDNPALQRAMDTFIILTRSADEISNRLIEKQTLSGLTPSQFGMLKTPFHLGLVSYPEIGAKLL